MSLPSEDREWTKSPRLWPRAKLKHAARLVYGDSLSSEKRQDGEATVFGSNGPLGTHAVSNMEAPAIVVGRKGSFGKVTYAKRGGFAIDTTYFIDRRSSSQHLRWLYYALFTLGLDETSHHAVVPGLSREKAHESRLRIPPLPTQKAIAAFLDRKTAAIDALIAKKQRLLDLLAEKRAALIHRAVTKGLDPSVPMKDSGVPWFGEIPAHWEVMQVRRVVRREQGWSPSCENRLAEPGEWGVLKVGCVNGGRFRSDEHKALPFDLRPDARLEIRPGDLLMSRANTRELVGSTAVVVESRRRLLLCDKLYRIRLQEERCRPTFFSLAMASAALRTQFEATSSSASSSMQNIGQEKLASFQMAVPPLAEQDAIVRYLSRRLSVTDEVVGKVERQLDRLQEYRQALITAAVTGQRDIDAACTDLPCAAESEAADFGATP